MERKHRAWRVLAGCCLLQAAVTGFANNTLGMYLEPLRDSLGAAAGEVSLLISVRSVTLALALLLVYRAYRRFPARPLMTVALLAYCTAYFLVTCATSLTQLYLAGLLMGFTGGFLMITPSTFIVNNWFRSRVGFAIGLSVCSSGFGGMVMNPVASLIIRSYGWRTSMYVTAALVLLLGLLSIWLLIVYRPEDVGDKPYGEKKNMANSVDDTGSYEKLPLRRRRSVVLLMLLITTLLGLSAQFSHIMPSYASSVGFAVTVGGMLSAMAMGGNVLSKLALGWLLDIHEKTRVIIGALLVVIGALVLLAFSKNVVLSSIAALFFGISMSFATVCSPVLVRTIFGTRRYDDIYSKYSTIAMLAASGYFAMVGYCYDYFGSYSPVFLFHAGLYLITIVLLLVCRRMICLADHEVDLLQP